MAEQVFVALLHLVRMRGGKTNPRPLPSELKEVLSNTFQVKKNTYSLERATKPFQLRARLGGDDLPVVFGSLLPAIADSEEPALVASAFLVFKGDN
jgi:hypothetical protein